MEIFVPSYSILDDATKNPALLKLYKYWDKKRCVRQMPSRDDIDPLEFAFALNRVSLVDVGVGPKRFHYRLVSTTLTERLGYEMTNRNALEIPDEDVREYVIELYSRAVAARMPIFEKSERIYEYKLWDHEALLLPLSSNDRSVEMLMIYRGIFNPRPLPSWAKTDH